MKTKIPTESIIKIKDFEQYDKETFQIAMEGYINTLPYVRADIELKNVPRKKGDKDPVVAELKAIDMDKGTILVRWLYDVALTDWTPRISGYGKTLNGKIMYKFITNIELVNEWE